MKLTLKQARKILDNLGKGPRKNGFGRWITDKEVYYAIQVVRSKGGEN